MAFSALAGKRVNDFVFGAIRFGLPVRQEIPLCCFGPSRCWMPYQEQGADGAGGSEVVLERELVEHRKNSLIADVP